MAISSASRSHRSSQSAGCDNCDIFIGNLLPNTDENSLRDLVRGRVFYGDDKGQIVDVKIKRSHTSGGNLGYGFVRLKSPEAASSCIVKLNNFPFNGRNLIANKAQKKAKLVVENIRATMDRSVFIALFREFGELIESVTDVQELEPSHHVLIIEYKHRFDAERAKAELDGREVEGFALHIYWFDSFPGRSRLVDRSANASVVSVHFKYSYKFHSRPRGLPEVEIRRIFNQVLFDPNATESQINDVIVKDRSRDADASVGWGFVGFCNTVEGIRAALRSTVSMKDYVIDNVRFRVEESDNLKRHPLRSQVSDAVEREGANLGEGTENALGGFGDEEVTETDSNYQRQSDNPASRTHLMVSVPHSPASGIPQQPNRRGHGGGGRPAEEPVQYVPPFFVPHVVNNPPVSPMQLYPPTNLNIVTQPYPQVLYSPGGYIMVRSPLGTFGNTSPHISQQGQYFPGMTPQGYVISPMINGNNSQGGRSGSTDGTSPYYGRPPVVHPFQVQHQQPYSPPVPGYPTAYAGDLEVPSLGPTRGHGPFPSSPPYYHHTNVGSYPLGPPPFSPTYSGSHVTRPYFHMGTAVPERGGEVGYRVGGPTSDRITMNTQSHRTGYVNRSGSTDSGGGGSVGPSGSGGSFHSRHQNPRNAHPPMRQHNGGSLSRGNGSWQHNHNTWGSRREGSSHCQDDVDYQSNARETEAPHTPSSSSLETGADGVQAVSHGGSVDGAAEIQSNAVNVNDEEEWSSEQEERARVPYPRVSLHVDSPLTDTSSVGVNPSPNSVALHSPIYSVTATSASPHISTNKPTASDTALRAHLRNMNINQTPTTNSPSVSVSAARRASPYQSQAKVMTQNQMQGQVNQPIAKQPRATSSTASIANRFAKLQSADKVTKPDPIPQVFSEGALSKDAGIVEEKRELVADTVVDEPVREGMNTCGSNEGN